jgi:hypothetical protein
VDTGALLSVPVGHPHRLHCGRGLGVPGRPPGQDEGTASSNPSQVQGKLDISTVVKNRQTPIFRHRFFRKQCFL